MNAPRPKYQEIADALESEVGAGRWEGGRMPSVRGIARQFSVSIVTASRALQVLRDRGMVRQVERSGTFCHPAPGAERWAVVLRLTPGPLVGAVESTVRGGFEAYARRCPTHLYFDAFQIDGSLTKAKALRAAKAAKREGIGGLFLLPSRVSVAAARIDAAFLAGCRAAGLPVVLLERNLRGRDFDVEYDLVRFDDLGGTIAATRHLMGLGRQRIALVVASPTTTHNIRVAGYLFALHAARKGAQSEHVLWLPDELPSERVARHIADRVVKEKLDAIICYHDYIAIAAIVELLRRGLRVPRDVAVIGYDNIDAAGLFGIRLTTVENPFEQMAEQAIHLMRQRLQEPGRPPVRIIVPSRLIVRESTQTKY